MAVHNTPLVSVVIPCFNQAEYLTECIDSVKASDYAHIEIIVVDDGSYETASRSFFDSFSIPGVTLIRRKNAGLSEARNTGIRASAGAYILPLDADDKISSRYISRAVEVLESRPEVKMVYCKAEYFGAKTGIWDLAPFDRQTFFTQNLIFCTALFRRSDYDSTPGYNPNMKFGFEDWDFWMSLLEQGGEVYRIPEIHFFYRVKPGSMVRSMDAEKIAYLRNRIFKNHLHFYAEHFQDPVNLYWKLRQAESFKTDYENLLNSRDYRLGRTILAPLRWIKSLFAS
jgi:glycosyltransferase involved in cell wall biosynthesis